MQAGHITFSASPTAPAACRRRPQASRPSPAAACAACSRRAAPTSGSGASPAHSCVKQTALTVCGATSERHRCAPYVLEPCTRLWLSLPQFQAETWAPCIPAAASSAPRHTHAASTTHVPLGRRRGGEEGRAPHELQQLLAGLLVADAARDADAHVVGAHLHDQRPVCPAGQGIQGLGLQGLALIPCQELRCACACCAQPPACFGPPLPGGARPHHNPPAA